MCRHSLAPISTLCLLAAACGRTSPATDRAALAVLDSAVHSGQVVGVMGLVAEDGDVVFLEAAGESAPGTPMPTDAIVRTASIGKAVTAAAAMMLVEDGRLRLDQPVQELIPAYRDILVRRADSSLAPPHRPIVIRDLLTHQAGFVVSGEGHDSAWEEPTVRAFADRLARVPLEFEPGEGFAYGPSYEVLAAAIEVASGQRFDRFLQQRIFDPLAMHDTHFFVPIAKRSRLPAVYQRQAGGTLTMFRQPGEEEAPSEFFAGGGGLRTTLGDFHRFTQMLLDGGVANGTQILARESIRAMMTDHVGPEVGWPGDWGWGYGGAVRRATTDAADPGSLGAFGWNGGTGSQFLIDPTLRRISIIFTQLRPPPRELTVREEFLRAVYGTEATGDASRN